MATTASDAALSRLTALHPSSIDLGLGRVERLLEALGEPQRNLPPVIHVAGTNGKGSTIAFMRAALEAAGKRVHAYTSPHLVSFHERITLGGRAIGEDELAALLREVEVVNGAGDVVFSADGGKEAGYHEVEWSGGRGGMRRMSGGRARGPQPGQFAVRITHQGRTSTQAFTVHDRRGATSVLGSYPGEEVTDEEEADGGDGR